jgi:hypothetical protein
MMCFMNVLTPYVKNNISTLLVNALATIHSPARIPDKSGYWSCANIKKTYKITIHCTFIKHIVTVERATSNFLAIVWRKQPFCTKCVLVNQYN